MPAIPYSRQSMSLQMTLAQKGEDQLTEMIADHQGKAYDI